MIYLLQTSDPLRVIAVGPGATVEVVSVERLPDGWRAELHPSVVQPGQFGLARAAADAAGVTLVQPNQVAMVPDGSIAPLAPQGKRSILPLAAPGTAGPHDHLEIWQEEGIGYTRYWLRWVGADGSAGPMTGPGLYADALIGPAVLDWYRHRWQDRALPAPAPDAAPLAAEVGV